MGECLLSTLDSIKCLQLTKQAGKDGRRKYLLWKFSHLLKKNNQTFCKIKLRCHHVILTCLKLILNFLMINIAINNIFVGIKNVNPLLYIWNICNMYIIYVIYIVIFICVFNKGQTQSCLWIFNLLIWK